jgi:alkylated DNA repair dioxygenase AlkB
MNFHSDDEEGVQGTIASVSLGAPAKMSFRSKMDSSDKDVVTILLHHVSLANGNLEGQKS